MSLRERIKSLGDEVKPPIVWYKLRRDAYERCVDIRNHPLPDGTYSIHELQDIFPTITTNLGARQILEVVIDKIIGQPLQRDYINHNRTPSVHIKYDCYQFTIFMDALDEIKEEDIL